ncbi:MAG: thymidylate synthase [Patescibacteria group bacterium]|nr:MAG: thymidylate synthase [Patescibacteria group bacterium]
MSTNEVDKQYLLLLQDILKNGKKSKDRTGTGTIRVFGRMLKFDLQKGFPLLTTKKVWFKGVKEELLWFLRGERNIRNLVISGVNIWNEWPFQRYLESRGLDKKYPKYTKAWEKEMEKFIEKIKKDKKFAKKYGDLGPVYGFVWRNFKGRGKKSVDQIKEAIRLIKEEPHSRRIIVSAWDPTTIKEVALPPCHLYFQFQVEGKKLNCFMVQRSVDTFLGLPFNIASYALLTHLIAKITGKKAGELTMALGDTHLYLNHIKQAKEQLKRKPKDLPQLVLSPKIKDIGNIKSEWIDIKNYDPHPAIPAPISV